MGTLNIVFYISMAAWLLSEIIYKRKLRSEDNDKKKDNSTLNILWIVIILSVASAVSVSYIFELPITDKTWIFYIGEAFVLLGIVFRLIIIRSLGKYFTVDVAIRENHRIKKEGFYKYLRHPSYAFSLLTFLGLGLFLNNWLSLVLALIPPFLAFNYRMKVEERALIEEFGDEYIQYQRNTKRILPFLY